MPSTPTPIARHQATTYATDDHHQTNLIPGPYRIDVERTGFRKVIIPDVILHYASGWFVPPTPARAIQTFPWNRFGRDDPAISIIADPRSGGLWLGFDRGGIMHLADGEVRASYGASEGVTASTVKRSSFRFGRHSVACD